MAKHEIINAPGIPFEPLYDKVVLRQKEAEKQTATGIILPDAAQERFNEGVILAVGPGYRMEDGTVQALRVSPGDVVLYAKYGGVTIDIGEHKDLVILSERDIHGILHEEEEGHEE